MNNYVNDIDPEDDPEPTIGCEKCNGMGEYAVNSGGPDGEEYVRCDGCEGSGVRQ